MHSEGDNWHCVPAESRREIFWSKWSRGRKSERSPNRHWQKQRTFPLIVEDFHVLRIDLVLIDVIKIKGRMNTEMGRICNTAERFVGKLKNWYLSQNWTWPGTWLAKQWLCPTSEWNYSPARAAREWTKSSNARGKNSNSVLNPHGTLNISLQLMVKSLKTVDEHIL